MVILIDTNIILDYSAKRRQFFADAQKIMRLCFLHKINGYIAFHSLPTAFYVMRNEYSREERIAVLHRLCSFLTVVACPHEKVREALSNGAISDFEDALQIECAKVCNADFIVTRDFADYEKSEVTAISPTTLLKLLG